MIYPLLFGIGLAILSSLLVVQVVKKTTELQNPVDSQQLKLINTETKFKTIFDQAAIGIALVTPTDGRFLQVNKKLCDILGYKESELLNLSFQNITLPNHPNGVRADVKYFNNGSVKEYRVQKNICTKRGTQSGVILWKHLCGMIMVNQPTTL
ncbi:PAS domain S-box protein [Pedobacter panaciterrae]